MDISIIIDLGRETLRTALLVAAPILLLSLVVGLLISILQATTQIQEQSLSFVPKIIAVVVGLVLFGPWMMQMLKEFTTNIFLNMNQYIK